MMSQTQNDFSIPYRSDDELKEEARKFLASYNPENTVPVPIEHIADYALGISILPTKDLERVWGIDAFINSRLDTIVIDYWAYMNQEARSRFSIAHEIAHKVLHADIYEQLEIEDEKSYLHFQENGNLTGKGSMEYQAYCFAGYVVLPESTFNPRFEELYNSLSSVDVDELYQMMRILEDEFQVSGVCLEKQIRREFPDIFTHITELKDIP
jgi:hypothetical protein